MGEGRVHYRIWAQEGDRANLVYFDERLMSESMRPLVDWLSNVAEGAVYISFEPPGMPLISTNSLGMVPARAKQLRRLIESSRFFYLPTVISSGTEPGRYRYRITMNACGVPHAVSVPEGADPGTLAPLGFLRSEAATAMQRARCSVRR
jgi:hypothetical protein